MRAEPPPEGILCPGGGRHCGSAATAVATSRSIGGASDSLRVELLPAVRQSSREPCSMKLIGDPKRAAWAAPAAFSCAEEFRHDRGTGAPGHGIFLDGDHARCGVAASRQRPARSSSGLTKRMLTTVASRRFRRCFSADFDHARRTRGSASPLRPSRRISALPMGSALHDFGHRRDAGTLVRADSAPRPADPRAWSRCRASAGIRSRRRAPSPPCWGCSAGRNHVVAALVGGAVAADKAGAIEWRTRRAASAAPRHG